MPFLFAAQFAPRARLLAFGDLSSCRLDPGADAGLSARGAGFLGRHWRGWCGVAVLRLWAAKRSLISSKHTHLITSATITRYLEWISRRHAHKFVVDGTKSENGRHSLIADTSRNSTPTFPPRSD